MIQYRPHYPRRAIAPTPTGSELLTRLLYELLDAHDDTARIANCQHLDPRWQTHLSYLRDLQRVARGLLARAGQKQGAETSRPVGWFAPSGGSVSVFRASADSNTAGLYRSRNSPNSKGGAR